MAAGVALRAFRLDWGLPGFLFPDTLTLVRPAAAAARGAPVSPEGFVNPPLLLYLLSGAFRLWSFAVGTPVPAPGPGFLAQAAALILVGRMVVVGCAALSIVLLYLLGRRLLGPRPALLGAAVWAFAPLDVLESHRLSTDVPATVFVLAATWLAVAAVRRRTEAMLLAGFFAAGLAGATKYTGVFAAPACALVAVAWPESSVGRRAALLAAGGMLAAAGFAFGCVPCLYRPDRFLAAFRLMRAAGYVVGMPGVELAAGWTQRRYVYPLVVALPYMLGWPAYLASVAGLGVLWRRNRWAAAVLIASIVPLFLLLGGSTSAVPRYYLALGPFLALAAGALLDALWQGGARRRTAAALLTAGVFGYGALLSASHVARLGLAPQREVGVLVGRLAAEAGATPEHRLVVAYPNVIALAYDAVRPFIRRPDTSIVQFPHPYRHLADEARSRTREEDAVSAELTWVREARIDVVVVPTWVRNAVTRASPDGPTAGFFGRLAAGRLGFVPVLEARSHYLTERLYTWGDPMLDTYWETAVVGYTVYRRTAPVGVAPAAD